MLGSLARDFTYAARALRRTPAFALASIALLAVAIGGTTIVFSLTDTLLLRRLAVPQPGQLVRMISILPGRAPVSYFPYVQYEEWRVRTRTIAQTFAEADLDATLEEGGGSTLVRTGIVSADYFSSLGATPALGRLLGPADDWATGGELPAVLSYQFWQSRFHGDATAVGRLLRINGRSFTIVGVLPRSFTGTTVDSGPAIRVPLIAGKYLGRDQDARNCCFWEIGGRLRPGVTLAQANTESVAALQEAILAIAGRARPLTAEQRKSALSDDYRLESIERGVSVLRTRFGTGLIVLFGGAALLLVLACANIAGLLLARAAGREREMAVRAALGASRARLMRHWLAESATLSMLGGVFGLLLARACLPLIAGSLPAIRDLVTLPVPVSLDTTLDARVFAFTFLLCSGAALLAGLAPAWHTSRARLNDSLKAAAPDPSRTRLRTLLTVAQVAIGTLVLAVSGLLVATLHRLSNVPAGFDSGHVVTFTMDTTFARYTRDQNRALAERLEREAAAIPGVARAAIGGRSLMRGSGIKTSVALSGQRGPHDLNASTNAVSPAWFETMGMRIVAGRNLNENDGAPGAPGTPTRVVVNQSFVRRFFPSDSPLGKQFGIGRDSIVKADFEIVGVVTDARYRSFREPFQPTLFSCYCGVRNADGYMSLEVRAAGPPEAVIASVEALMRSIDPRLPFREVRTLRRDVDDSLWAERSLASAGSAMSILASVIACVGLYGLLTFTLTQRRREIGIRIALGARPADIGRATLLRILAILLTGAAIGIAGAIPAARLMNTVLFEITPTDLGSNAAAVILMLLAGLAASALPAWRASRLDPWQSLRAE
jgi:predicted permease